MMGRTSPLLLVLALVFFCSGLAATETCTIAGDGMVNGKVIIVTGATSGIGRTTAIELAKEGAKVVLTGRRVEKGNAVVEEIKAFGGEASFIKTDVSVEADVKNMVDKTLELYGRLDGAFNNAGVAGGVPLSDLTEDFYNYMYNINVKGVMLCTKYEAEAMKRNGAEGGSILNHASITAVRVYPGRAVYGSSKAAVVHFSNVAAAELGPDNIRVNSLNTGLVPDTEIWDNRPDVADAAAKDALVAMYSKIIPMRRPGLTVEIAKPVLFFMSDMSSYVTGSALEVDGGVTV